MKSLSLLFALSLFLLCVPRLASAQEQSGYPNFVPQDCFGPTCVNLLANTVNLNVPIRSKAGLIPVTVSGAASYYMTNVIGNWLPASLATTNFSAGANVFLGVFGNVGAQATVATPGTPCTGSGTTTKYTGWVVEGNNYTVHPLSATLYTDANSSGVSCITGSGFTNQQTTDGSGLTASAAANSSTASSTYTRSGVSLAGSVLTDSHGNTLTKSSGALKDSMGLDAITSGFGTATGPFTWTDVNGGSPQVSLTIPASTNVETNFSCTGINEYGPFTISSADLPTAITLADNTTIGLAYEPTPSKSGYVTGRLQEITLPTAGTISYAYSDTLGHNGIDCTHYTVPKLTQTLGNGDTTTFSLSYGPGTYVTNTVVDPGGNNTVYTFGIGGTAQVVVLKTTYSGAVLAGNTVVTHTYTYNRAFSASPTVSYIVNCSAPL